MQRGIGKSFVLMVLSAVLVNSSFAFNWNDDDDFQVDNWDSWDDGWGGDWPNWDKQDGYDEFEKWAMGEKPVRPKKQQKNKELQQTLISMREREFAFLRKIFKLVNRMERSKGGDLQCLLKELAMMTSVHKKWFKKLIAKAGLPAIKPTFTKRPCYKSKVVTRPKRKKKRWVHKPLRIRYKKKDKLKTRKKKKQRQITWNTDNDDDGWIGSWNGATGDNQNNFTYKSEKRIHHKPKSKHNCHETNTYTQVHKKLKNGGFMFSNTNNHSKTESSFSSFGNW